MKHPWKMMAAALALSAGAGLSACGTGAQPAAIAQTIRVVGTEMAFSPAAATTGEGRHRFVFSNEGAVYHELAVVSPGGDVLAARSIPAGETATFDVELDRPGTYRMVCREPGHAGMVGTLTVTG